MNKPKTYAIPIFLIVCLVISIVVAVHQRGAETGGSVIYPAGYFERHIDMPSVMAPCYATAAQIDAYFLRVAPAYSGCGKAIVTVCKRYGYDPAFICALMLHEGGSTVLGTWAAPPYYNPFSWGVSDSDPSYAKYGSYSNAVLTIVPRIYAYYHAKGAAYNHGNALLGMAVSYVGGPGDQLKNDEAWASSIESIMQGFYAKVYPATTTLKVKYLRDGTLHLDGTKDYWTRPLTRTDMLWLMEKIDVTPKN